MDIFVTYKCGKLHIKIGVTFLKLLFGRQGTAYKKNYFCDYIYP